MEIKNKELKEFLLLSKVFVALLIIIWFFFSVVIGMIMIPTDDMNPRMDAGDIAIYYRLDKNMGTDDVIVFNKNNTDYVGRVVAKSNDTIEITDDSKVKVNGNVLTEKNITSPTVKLQDFVDYPLKLSDNECFVLVDSRGKIEDSRYFGAVKKSEIKGTIIWICRMRNF